MSQQSNISGVRKEQPAYEVVKTLSEDVYIVRRFSDGQRFIGHEWGLDEDAETDDVSSLLKRGAEAPVWALLNHENLLSIVGTADNLVFSGTGDRPRRLLLWDFADAGTLEALFAEPPLYATQAGFLPESLCWHVVISVLRALAWLHEGYREEYYIAPVAGKLDCEKKQWVVDSDWMPILHRNITPKNIFFQHPKGSETYGFCKLGNFGKAFVSGHVNDKSGGPVVTVRSGDAPMAELRKTMEAEDIYTIPKSERPYTKGTELYKLGAILYCMMTGVVAPPEEECDDCGCRHMDESTPNCPHPDCHEDLNIDVLDGRLADYTAGLRELLFILLTECRGSGTAVNTIYCLEHANGGCGWWKYNTPDGKLNVEWDDEVGTRWTNILRKQKEAAGKDGVVGVV